VLKSFLNGGSLQTDLTSKRVTVIISLLGRTENISLLLLLKLFPWEGVSFVKALPTDGCAIVAYLAVIA
jgi:hypothetical protein